jgi:hypothetical protein
MLHQRPGLSMLRHLLRRNIQHGGGTAIWTRGVRIVVSASQTLPAKALKTVEWLLVWYFHAAAALTTVQALRQIVKTASTSDTPRSLPATALQRWHDNWPQVTPVGSPQRRTAPGTRDRKHVLRFSAACFMDSNSVDESLRRSPWGYAEHM